MLAFSPLFQSIRGDLAVMPKACRESAGRARERQARLTKPAGSLGRLEEVVEFLAAWQAKPVPTVDRGLVLVFASNHGVVAKGVSAFPATVTRAMVENFGSGGAAINQLCATYGLDLQVVELELDRPTADITESPAMDAKEAAVTFARGIEAVARDRDLVCLGEMGIGNTTIAAAIYHALYGGSAADWVGRGTGIDDEMLRNKIAVVGAAVARHRAFLADPLEVMARLGGREIVAIAGAIIGARQARIPVILDGYVVCAAAAILHSLDKTALDHCLAAHVSAEGAHGEVLRRLGLVPLLDLGLRLGEGSGAALAAGIVKAAVACHRGMATFAEAEVATRLGTPPVPAGDSHA